MTRPLQSDAPAKQGDRMGTHSASCWSFGPRHYECALNEIERLAALQAALTDRLVVLEALQKADDDVFDRFVPRPRP